MRIFHSARRCRFPRFHVLVSTVSTIQRSFLPRARRPTAYGSPPRPTVSSELRRRRCTQHTRENEPVLPAKRCARFARAETRGEDSDATCQADARAPGRCARGRASRREHISYWMRPTIPWRTPPRPDSSVQPTPRAAAAGRLLPRLGLLEEYKVRAPAKSRAELQDPIEAITHKDAGHQRRCCRYGGERRRGCDREGDLCGVDTAAGR